MAHQALGFVDRLAILDRTGALGQAATIGQRRDVSGEILRRGLRAEAESRRVLGRRLRTGIATRERH